MNELIVNSIVRQKRAELIAQAKSERAIRANEPAPRSLRRSIASAFATVGGACFKLSSALADR
jgi:hypothetical protein